MSRVAPEMYIGVIKTKGLKGHVLSFTKTAAALHSSQVSLSSEIKGRYGYAMLEAKLNTKGAGTLWGNWNIYE